MSKIGEWWKSLFGRDVVPNQAEHGHTSEVGYRPTMERRARLENPLFAVDYEYRAVVADIRRMDRQDGRVKRIHNRVARDVTRGGLVLNQPNPSKRVQREWRAFISRLQLDNAQKLKSDARALVMEGNLPMQWEIDDAGREVTRERKP